MANPNKAQGTRWERDTRLDLEAAGFQVRRLAEEGMYDVGDLEITGRHHRDFLDGAVILECRARNVMQVHRALAKAKRKAGHHRVAIVWKRLVGKKGDGPRQPVDGQPVAVIIDPEFWKELLDEYT